MTNGRKRFPKKRLSGICICILLVLSFPCSPISYEPHLESRELIPILKQNNLETLDPPESRREVAEVEDLDSKLYEPLAAKTMFLRATAPTADSNGMTPRYWLRVEDYATAELAVKRMSEYRAVGTYDRLEKACKTDVTIWQGSCDSFFLSKMSVRIWAVARGKRVYALTTDANLFTLIELPTNLRNAIARLPET